MSDRFEQLTPRDVAITLSSLGRRFGTVASAAQDPDVASMVDAVGPSGDSLSGLLSEAAKTVAFLANEIDRGLDHEAPVIPAGALNADERSFVDAPPSDLATAAESIKEDGDRAGKRIADASSDELTRELPLAGGGTTTVEALSQELARSAIGLLTQSERQLDRLQDN